MVAVKRRADLKRTEEEKAAEKKNARKTIQAGTRAKSKIWDNEDDSDSASEYEPLQILRYAGLQATRDEMGAGPSHGDISNTPLAKENTKG